MVRPACFYPNPETASDNAFQREVAAGDAGSISKTAQDEFDRAVTQLRDAGVMVHVLNDTASPEKPDAVFQTIGSPPITMGELHFTQCIPPHVDPSGGSI